MTAPLSVNAAVDALDKLAGEDVFVTGVLHFGFEDVSLNHWPQLERRDGYQSSIWLFAGFGSLGFDPTACERMSGKRVLVRGSLLKPDPALGGCGHFSLWPAELQARTLELA
jgi:hypothetical protein